jgi:hypothetical protein
MRFKKYLLREFVFVSSVTDLKRWERAVDRAHDQNGSVVWAYQPQSKSFVWTIVGGKSIYHNGKKVKTDKAPGIGYITHAALTGTMEKIEKSESVHWSNWLMGRITKDGQIIIYDEKIKKARDIDKMIDAIYKYIKE